MMRLLPVPPRAFALAVLMAAALVPAGCASVGVGGAVITSSPENGTQVRGGAAGLSTGPDGITASRVTIDGGSAGGY
ncbi:hypothetical protein V6L77_24255 [Pannonibacter sp. Pt2-lr]|uniref:Uncharacterized protein n=1 Tax=Pannonibacter anstelovis TaxID=3121537 RepID=A0ABU7ZI35_9HYPH